MKGVTRGRGSPRDAAASAAMQRYAAGDDAAFGELYDVLASRIFAYLLRRTRDVSRTEDLVQQTLLHIHRARSSFIAGANVMPWAYAIARRLLIDGARSDKREAMLINTDGYALVITAKSACADDILQARQLAVRMESELARLPEPQRVAFELMKRRGLSLGETAAALKISVGAVKLRIHRAHHALRAALSGWQETA